MNGDEESEESDDCEWMKTTELAERVATFPPKGGRVRENGGVVVSRLRDDAGCASKLSARPSFGSAICSGETDELRSAIFQFFRSDTGQHRCVSIVPRSALTCVAEAAGRMSISWRMID